MAGLLNDMKIMRFRRSQEISGWAIAFALSAQLLGLIFCGDADCLRGGADENCATLICGLFTKHSAAASPSGSSQNDSCQCFCHALINLPRIALAAVTLPSASFHPVEALRPVSAPIRSIDHPPFA
jgi:hypothetical protein